MPYIMATTSCLNRPKPNGFGRFKQDVVLTVYGINISHKKTVYD